MLIIGAICLASLMGLASGAAPASGQLEDLLGEPHMILDVLPANARSAGHRAMDYRILAELLSDKSRPVDSLGELNQLVGQLFSLRSRWPTRLPKTIPFMHRRDPVPQEAIAMLSALPSAVNRCDWPAYEILLKNYLAALGHELSLKATDRIKSAVWSAIGLHNEKCRSGHYARFESLLGSLDEGLKDKIDQILDTSLIEEILSIPEQTISSKVYHSNELLLDKIIQLSQNSEDKKYIQVVSSGGSHSKRSKLSPPDEFIYETVQNHLLKPCHDYQQHFAELFFPVILDLALNHGTSLDAINPSHNPAFMDALQKFTICGAISERSAVVSQRIARSLVDRSV